MVWTPGGPVAADYNRLRSTKEKKNPNFKAMLN